MNEVYLSRQPARLAPHFARIAGVGRQDRKDKLKAFIFIILASLWLCVKTLFSVFPVMGKEETK